MAQRSDLTPLRMQLSLHLLDPRCGVRLCFCQLKRGQLPSFSLRHFVGGFLLRLGTSMPLPFCVCFCPRVHIRVRS